MASGWRKQIILSYVRMTSEYKSCWRAKAKFIKWSRKIRFKDSTLLYRTFSIWSSMDLKSSHIFDVVKISRAADRNSTKYRNTNRRFGEFFQFQKASEEAFSNITELSLISWIHSFPTGRINYFPLFNLLLIFCPGARALLVKCFPLPPVSAKWWRQHYVSTEHFRIPEKTGENQTLNTS